MSPDDPWTPLLQALLDALASPEKDDGEIQFVVLGVDPKDKSKHTELGVSAPLIACTELGVSAALIASDDLLMTPLIR